jgi:DNA-binding NtrC family response regulator
VLVVDDDRTLREGCANILRVDGHQVVACGRGEDAIAAVGGSTFDLALVDLYMTPVSGMDVLRAITAASPETLVVVMTGNPTVASSLDALRAGAWDYLPKPFSASHLQVLVGRAAHAPPAPRAPRDLRPAATGGDRRARGGRGGRRRRHAHRQSPRLPPGRGHGAPRGRHRRLGDDLRRERHGQGGHRPVHPPHSRAQGKQARRGQLRRAPGRAARERDVRAQEGRVHRRRPRQGGPARVGRRRHLFLDELGEMPMPLQAKLLRVLQDGVVRRVGSEKPDAVVNVRFVAATNRDPHEAMRAGLLREDLFYRLCVVPMKLPPLRQRPEDIPTLAAPLPDALLGAPPQGRHAPPRAQRRGDRLPAARPWKGNVRELQNLIEHVTVVAEPGRPIYPDDIPVYDEEHDGRRADAGVPAAIYKESFHAAKEQLIAHFEREYLAGCRRARPATCRARRGSPASTAPRSTGSWRSTSSAATTPSPLVGMAGWR